jgi:hypothetical protein
LVAGPLFIGCGQHGSLSSVCRRLRPHLKDEKVIYLTDVIVALLFVYLGVALVRPEWF